MKQHNLKIIRSILILLLLSGLLLGLGILAGQKGCVWEKFTYEPLVYTILSFSDPGTSLLAILLLPFTAFLLMGDAGNFLIRLGMDSLRYGPISAAAFVGLGLVRMAVSFYILHRGSRSCQNCLRSFCGMALLPAFLGTALAAAAVVYCVSNDLVTSGSWVCVSLLCCLAAAISLAVSFFRVVKLRQEKTEIHS